MLSSQSGVSVASQAESTTPVPGSLFRRWEILILSAVILAVLALTALPHLFAYASTPPDQHFMGVMVNIPDHAQYFSWMRDARTQVLVPNRLTPEDTAPLLFNFLWWGLAQIETLTGIDYAGLYQMTRLLAGVLLMAGTYFFCSIVFSNRLKRWTSFLIATLGGGFGYIWIVEKYLTGQELSLEKSFDLFTSEPNSFFNILAFPHFSIAAGLIAVIMGLILLGQRSKKMHYAWAAAAVSLLLSVQHAYDMAIIYPVIGLYGLFIWIRDRKFPLYLFKLGLIVVLVSVWPALQAFIITNSDPVWKEVLAQFDNAGAFTPSPLHLPILMGFAWLLAIWALPVRRPLKERDDTQLFIVAWFLAHFVLVYLPVDFQIHLLSGWQIVAAVLATIGLYTRVLPILQRVFKRATSQSLIRAASAALILIVIPVNLYLFAWRFIDLRRAEAPFYMPTDSIAAYDYLETRVASDDVVFSSLTSGQFVPMLTDARAYLGHWAQTLDFHGKSADVETFFAANTEDSWRQALILEYGLDYVIYSPFEASLGDFDPAAAGYLEEVFRSGETVVYAVTSTA